MIAIEIRYSCFVYTVRVIERSYFDNEPEAIAPWYSNGLDTSVMLNFPSAPITALDNGWEELGNPGWGWDALLPYFQRSTTFKSPSREATEQ